MMTQTETAVYPKTKLDGYKWEWMSIQDILNGQSGDFECVECPQCGARNWCDHGWQRKRDQYTYGTQHYTEYHGYMDWSDFVTDIEWRGIDQPLSWYSGRLNNGHHRLLACIELGYTHVPVHHQTGGF